MYSETNKYNFKRFFGQSICVKSGFVFLFVVLGSGEQTKTNPSVTWIQVTNYQCTASWYFGRVVMQ